MDINSFEYQTALEQITWKEQHETSEMLDVFSGVWWKENYIFIWDWVRFLQLSFFAVILFVGVIKEFEVPISF